MLRAAVRRGSTFLLPAVLTKFQPALAYRVPRSFSARPTPVGRVKGVNDLFPETMESFLHIENTMREVAQLHGFNEIRTPILESPAVFERPLGESSDVVLKEMFRLNTKEHRHFSHAQAAQFQSNPSSLASSSSSSSSSFSSTSPSSSKPQIKDEHQVVLRPENTAGVVRALVERGCASGRPERLFYCGPMFRKEDPQRGRMRQFTQFGVEYIGEGRANVDVEGIEMAAEALDKLGLLQHTTLEINSLGTSSCRAEYYQVLKRWLTQRKRLLSPISQHRLSTGAVLRILDSKEAGDIALVKGTLDQDLIDLLEDDGVPYDEASQPAPLLSQCLSEESRQRFEEVKDGLDRVGIQYKVNPYLMRGLDYYCHTAFEFIDNGRAGHGQNAVLAGGRYDGLTKLMGGDDLPSFGWAAGVERLDLLRRSLDLASPPHKGLAAVCVVRPKDFKSDDSGNIYGHRIAKMLREVGIRTVLYHEGNIKRQMQKAVRENVMVVVLVGSDEVSDGSARLKDMRSGEQQHVPVEQIAQCVQQRLSQLQVEGASTNASATSS